MSTAWCIFVILILVALGCLKYWFGYWTRLGFPSLPPTVLGPVLRQKQCFGELFRDIHLRSKERVLGMYFLYRPALLIRDPVLVKRVLATDFDHFTDRGIYCDEEIDPMGANLFGMTGNRWKELRMKLSPTFTSGKLKHMFHAIMDKNQILKKELTNLTDTEDNVHLKSVLIHNNMNIIASVFFGLELNTFEEPDHQFTKIGTTYLDPNLLRNKIQMTSTFLLPSLMKVLKIPILSPVVSQYVLNLVHTVIEARTKDPSLVRSDFIQTVMEMMEQEKGQVNDGSKLSVEICAAQAFLFYLAGYESSASTTSFCIYELCKNPVWMERAREEVDALMLKRGGQIQYEDMTELKVLDMCIKESMRKFTSLPILNRECTKEYKIPDTDLTIPKGTAIIISTYGLNLDPENFPNPEKFDPTRFDSSINQDDLPFYPVRSYV